MKSQYLRFSSVIFTCSLLFVWLTNQAFSYQINGSKRLSEIYKDIITSQDDFLNYERINIIDDVSSIYDPKDKDAFVERLSKLIKMDIPVDSMGIVSPVKTIYMDYLTGNSLTFYLLNLEVLDMKVPKFDRLNFFNFHVDSVFVDSARITSMFQVKDSHFKEFFDTHSEYGAHHIDNTEYEQYYNMFYSTVHKDFRITKSRFKEGAHFGPHFEGTFTEFVLFESTFEPIDSELPFYQEGIVSDSVIFKTQVAFNFFGQPHQVEIEDNNFFSKGDAQYIYIQGEMDAFFFYGNLVESDIYANGNVDSRMDFLENDIKGKVSIADLVILSQNNHLKWSQFEGFKLSAASVVADMFNAEDNDYGLTFDQEETMFRQTSNFGILPFNGNTEAEFENEDSFQSLISSYYRLYKGFKENGQISDANQTYVEMKEVQLKQLRYKYKEYGGLENFIQWRLNVLLKIYTDFGTNPSKAIRISIFVMFVFSIFYFFFPSEWDTKSKGQLVSDYKVFVEKNDHGYFKPFMRLTKGFAISLINAMTLSLNSFVTLGFGSIPTSGLARYVCILQGFIGWFLLSIFTASLINQVMF